jgi:hypothetical protein
VGHNGLQTGSRLVTIEEEQGGLALQRVLRGVGWLVVHVASGYRVTARGLRKSEARALQRALLAVEGVDWTLPQWRLEGLPEPLVRQIATLAGLLEEPAPEGGPADG